MTFDLQLWMEESPMSGGYSTPPDKHYRFKISDERTHLKPENAFWTSTAVKTEDGYTSSWVEWCKNEMPEYLSPKGFIFKVKSQVKILTIHNDIEAEVIYHKHLGLDPEFTNLPLERALFIIKHFPWRLISAQYDGIHYDPDYSEDMPPLIMRAWDCESTVWFDMNALELIGEVKIT
jgi:hypothetical protein